MLTSPELRAVQSPGTAAATGDAELGTTHTSTQTHREEKCIYIQLSGSPDRARTGNSAAIRAGGSGPLTCSMSRSTGPALPPPRSDEASDIIGVSPRPSSSRPAPRRPAAPRPRRLRPAYSGPRQWGPTRPSAGARPPPAARVGESTRDPGAGRGLGGEEAAGELERRERDRGEVGEGEEWRGG